MIEPGVVVTEFGDTAIATAGEFTDLGGPYDTMMAGIATTAARAYEKPKRGSSITPDVVAARIEKAITARRPKTVLGRCCTRPARSSCRSPWWSSRPRWSNKFLTTQFPSPTPDA